jgi:hypothetical protein
MWAVSEWGHTHALRRAIIAGSCALLWACDGHDATAQDDDGAAEQDAGDEPSDESDGARDEPDPKDASSERDMDGGQSSSEAGTRDATTNARDAGQRDDRLQPFEVGRSWSYRRVWLDGGADATCEGSLESSVTKMVTRDAAVGYEYLPTCIGTTKVQMFLSGDDIWAYVGSAALQPIQYAASPVEAGVSWDGGAVQYVWEAQDTVSVPAGTFDRCIRRTGVTDKSGFLVLCRGVGLVLNENRSEGTRTELVSKNF